MNSFYELILLIFRTTNINIHFIFRLYKFCFNHFEKIRKIMRKNIYLYKIVIIKIYETIEIKFKKYYFKIKKSDLIYDSINILNFISKLNLYKI